MWRHAVTGGPAGLLPAARAVAAEAVRRGLDPDRAPQVTLAVQEALANARAHGHLGADHPPVHVEVAGCAAEVTIRVTDAALAGVWRPPTLPRDPLGEGGRGLVLLRALTDHLDVASTVGRTELTLRLRRAAEEVG